MEKTTEMTMETTENAKNTAAENVDAIQKETAAKKPRKKKEPAKKEPIPEMEEILADENGELPASVLTKSGNIICSCLHRTLHKNCIPVICDYGQTDSYGRGIEVYTAETEEQAKALLRLLTQAELDDRKAIGQSASVFYQKNDSYAEVINDQKKTDLSKFTLGHIVTGFSMDAAAVIPDTLSDLKPAPATAEKKPEPVKTSKEPEPAEETADQAAGLNTEENRALMEYLIGNPAMCAQFLNQTTDTLSDNKMVLQGMIMAQISFTEESILKQWYALTEKTA